MRRGYGINQVGAGYKRPAQLSTYKTPRSIGVQYSVKIFGRSLSLDFTIKGSAPRRSVHHGKPTCFGRPGIRYIRGLTLLESTNHRGCDLENDTTS